MKINRTAIAPSHPGRLLLDSPLGDSAPVHERTLSDIELDGERYADTLAARADFASSSDTSPSPGQRALGYGTASGSTNVPSIPQPGKHAQPCLHSNAVERADAGPF